MKKIILLLFLFLFTLQFSCKKELKKNNILLTEDSNYKVSNTNDSAIIFLQDFYTKYIIAVANEPLENIRDLQKNNLTKNFIKKIKRLDYDPVLFAQDSDEKLTKNIKVRFIEDNKYEVFFSFPGEEKTTGKCLLVQLVKIKNNYLINNVEKIYDNSRKSNLSDEISPEDFIFSIFYKDTKNNLQINTEKLEYISKNTTRENSSYLFALEGYEKKYRYSNHWSIDEFAKIRGYIFNTSYPLRRKYWSNKYEEWYNGEPEYIFGDSDSWRDNDYYGLPHLKEYVEDFIVTYW